MALSEGKNDWLFVGILIACIATFLNQTVSLLQALGVLYK